MKEWGLMNNHTSLSLHGKWDIRQVNGKIKIKGNVPGLVHHDLISQGIVDEPYFRMNEEQQQWVGDSVWEYSCDFLINKEQFNKRSIVLNCDGIDTVSDIYYNEDCHKKKLEEYEKELSKFDNLKKVA